MWRLMDRPSLLLLDARNHEEIQASLGAPRSNPYRYHIAFHDAITETDAAKLIDLGADDIVTQPGNPGEVLTCIQTGLRRIEFECRLAQTISSDPWSGLATGRGFARHLERKIQNRTGKSGSVVIALRIDSLEILSTQFGSLISEMANKTLAKCLAVQTTKEDSFALLEDGVFLVYLENSAVREGIQFAELIIKEFKAQNVLAPEFGVKITVSGTVLALPKKASAEEVIQRALIAFEQVTDSGGNQILDAQELEQSFATWRRQTTEPTPFHGTRAKHVMAPLPFVLPVDGSRSTHSESLGILALRSGAPQPPCSVVVDRQGCILGVVEQSYFDQLESKSPPSLEEHLVPVTATVDGARPLSELGELMDATESGYLIVLDDDKPIGYLTSDKLATTRFSSAAEQENSPSYQAEHNVESLVVPAT